MRPPSKRHLQHSMERKSQPSNILRIGFPPSFQVDEQRLHKVMILFGEVVIKSFPSRHYSLVEFRSIGEALHAKESLQGRLFNDPRITIMYSSSDMACGKEYLDIYPGSTGSIPDRPLQMNVDGHNLPLDPINNFHGSLTHGGSSNSQMGSYWKRPSPSARGMLPSPMPVIRPSSRSTSDAWDVLDRNRFQRDSKHLRIDDALVIGDTPFPLRNIYDRGLGLEQPFAIEPFIGGGSGPKSQLGPVGTGITSGVLGSIQPEIDHIWRGIIAKGGTPICRARCVPIGKGIRTEIPDVVDCTGKTGLDMLTTYYVDAVGFDIVFFLPDSEVDFESYTEFLRYLKGKNRAGVAMLADNTTLFLVPPSDFLTKVLRVRGPERLYGIVLKYPLVSGCASSQQAMHLPSPTTWNMQQIPPSQAEYGSVSIKDKQVLPVDCNRLLHEESKRLPKPLHPATSVPPSAHSVPPDYAPTYTASASQAGVTLTPELIATLTSLLPTTMQSSNTVGTMTMVGPSTVKPPFPPVAPNDGNQYHLWKQDQQIADPHSHPRQQFGSIHNAQYQPYPPASYTDHPAQVISGSSHIASNLQQPGAVLSAPMTNSITSQNGQIPTHNTQYQPYPPASYTVHPAQMVSGSSHIASNLQQPGAVLSAPMTNFITSQNGQIPTHNTQYQPYPPASYTVHPAQMVSGSSHTASTLQKLGAVSSTPMTNFITPQNGQVPPVSSQVSQQYQVGVPHSTNKCYGVVQASDASVLYDSKGLQQPNNFISSSDQVSNAASQQQTVMPYTVDKVNSEPPNQQHQPALFGVGQGMSESEADKNQRYQSTLQFATNLLQQIQQQQTQGEHGPQSQQ